MKKLLFFTLLSTTSHLLLAQAGTLNSSFGTSGKVTTPVGPGDDRSYASAIQADGKLVVAGNSNNGSNNDFAVVRYNTDGTLDASFGTGGKVTTDFGNEDNVASVALQPDGKIVVAGNVSDGNYFDFGVARYNSNGTLDAGFGTGGKLTLSIADGTDFVAGVHVLSDGKIMVTGTKTWSGYDYVLVRFSANGTLDNSFGSSGIVITNIYATDVAEASLLQPDGKIVIAGYTYQGGNTWEIARFNTDGTLDAGFGNGASGTFANGGGIIAGGMGGSIYGLALQADGKIVAVGSDGNTFEVVRYTADGSFDPTFNGNGRVSTFFGGVAAEAHSVALQTDGKIVVGGFSTNAGQDDFTLIRYSSNGAQDAGFGSGGIVMTDFSGGQDRVYSVKLSGSTIFASGFAYNSSNTTNDFTVASYLNDGIALPVRLVDFTGSKTGNRVLLDWHLSVDAQTAAFEIERSADGKQFTKIGKTPVSTPGSSVNAYRFVDEKLLQGTNFYRLKIVDNSGNFTFSKTIAIQNGENATSLFLFPNPANHLLQVQIASLQPGKISLQIQDITGRVVRSETLPSAGSNLATSVAIENLQKGVYYLVIKTGDFIQKGKFIKQ